MNSSNKYKIVFCTPALYSAGGTERVVAYKSSFFAERLGYDVTVIVTEGAGNKTFFPLSDKVNVVNLGVNFEEIWHKPFMQKVLAYLKKQHIYRRKLKKELIRLHPDITISTLRREINFICKIDDGSIKIGELHLSRKYYRGNEKHDSNIFKNIFYGWWRGDIAKQLMKLDRVVFLTDYAANEWH